MVKHKKHKIGKTVIIGLTGSIGMGKSTVACMLRAMGIPVHESDQEARHLIKPGCAGFAPVAQRFEPAWDKQSNVIRTDILGEIVFEDPQKRKELEEILHPLIRQAQNAFLLRCRRMNWKIAVLDIPLLFETGAQRRVDYTICVSAPPHVQRRRVLARPGMDEARFAGILAAQMPDAQKRARADFVLQTGIGYAHSFKRLKAIINQVTAAHLPGNGFFGGAEDETGKNGDDCIKERVTA